MYNKHFIIISLLICLCGCVERRIRIISDPSGADVLVDGKNVGQTPINIPFNFYGVREINLTKKGYHVFSRQVPIDAPLYQRFPIDFFVEVLYPFTIYDNHDLFLTLKPHVPLNAKQKQELLKRAQSLRDEKP